jgi:hypothetical protein
MGQRIAYSAGRSRLFAEDVLTYFSALAWRFLGGFGLSGLCLNARVDVVHLPAISSDLGPVDLIPEFPPHRNCARNLGVRQICIIRKRQNADDTHIRRRPRLIKSRMIDLCGHTMYAWHKQDAEMLQQQLKISCQDITVSL